MAIKSRLLNKTVTIERRSTTLDDSGDTTGARTEIEAALKMRIVKNELFGEGVGEESGPIAASSHKGITNGDHGGQTGDFVVDGTDEYVIKWIDKSPGGTITGDKIYHWEVFMNLSDAARV